MTPWTGVFRPALAGALALLLVMLPSAVLAHAELLSSSPADGETVGQLVTTISGRYSQDLGGNSHLEVKDAAGVTVATGGIDPKDARLMVARPAVPLAMGAFTVESTAISAEDGDIERTTWTFSVQASPTKTLPTPTAVRSTAPSATAASTLAPMSSPTPAISPSESPEPAPTSGSSGDVILPIVTALAIVAVGGYLLLARRRRTGTPR